MAGYNLLKRLEVIIDIIQRTPNISKAEIIERLYEHHDIDTTTRTLERDFKSLADDFGIEVHYHKSTNGYEIDTENQERIQSLLKFVELVHVGELFKEGLEDFELLRDKIEMEDSSKFRGIQHIKTILLAIKKNKDIGFIHENYYEETKKPYTITPLKLKEYLNRWYVIGVPKGMDEIRTFGVDRIEDLKLKTTSKISKERFDAQLDQFHYIVGLNYTEAEKAEKVVLKVNAKQIKYLDSLPLHHSQQIEVEQDATHGFVTYYLIPNYELKIQLLKMADMVEVKEPVWLRDSIIQMIDRMAKLYK